MSVKYRLVSRNFLLVVLVVLPLLIVLAQGQVRVPPFFPDELSQAIEASGYTVVVDERLGGMAIPALPPPDPQKNDKHCSQDLRFGGAELIRMAEKGFTLFSVHDGLMVRAVVRFADNFVYFALLHNGGAYTLARMETAAFVTHFSVAKGNMVAGKIFHILQQGQQGGISNIDIQEVSTKAELDQLMGWNGQC